MPNMATSSHTPDAIAVMHFGRSWDSHELEDACPCPKAPCGLVSRDNLNPDCDQHPTNRMKTLRQSHPADECPGPTAPKPPPTVEEIARRTVRRRIQNAAQKLKNMAEEVERELRRLPTDDADRRTTHAQAVVNVQHTILWGLANLNLSELVNDAYEADTARAARLSAAPTEH